MGIDHHRAPTVATHAQSVRRLARRLACITDRHRDKFVIRRPDYGGTCRNICNGRGGTPWIEPERMHRPIERPRTDDLAEIVDRWCGAVYNPAGTRGNKGPALVDN